MRRLSISILLLSLVACAPRGPLLVPGAPPPPGPTTVSIPTPTVTPTPQAARLGITATLDRATLPANKPSRVFARIAVDTTDIAVQQRGPIQLTLLVDTSGSMIGKPIDEARVAAKALLAALRDGDRLSIVTFDSTANVLVAPFVVDRSKLEPVEDAIDGMTARGTTDLSAGLGLALQQAMQHVAGVASRIVVLGDGVPNDASLIPQQVAVAKANAISISALGFGLEYDETVLASLAQGTGGRFHRIDADETITAAFTQEVMRIERTVASNVFVRLLPGPGVTIRRVIGHPTAPDSARAHTAHLNDLAEGQSHEVFVELEVGPHRDAANVELVDAQLIYDDRTVSGGRQERAAFLATTAAAKEAARDRDVAIGVALANAAAVSVDAIAKSHQLDFKGAESLLSVAEAEARKLATSLDEAKLRHEADELATLRRVLAEGRRRHDAAVREATKAATKAKKEAQRTATRGRDGAFGPVARPVEEPADHAPMAAPAPAAELDAVKRAHGRAFDMLQAR